MSYPLTPWPDLDRAIWTAITLLGALAVGLVINRVVIYQLQRLARRTHGDWDDAVVGELRKRIPFWAVLGGLWVAVGYWPLQPRWALLLTRVVAALAVISVTTAIAAISVRLMTAVAPRVSPELRVSGLMKNVVRLVIFTIGILVLLRGVGVEITPMLAALGVGGLAVALALQEPLSNLFAGLFVTLGGQMRIGDYIRLEGGPEGYIADFRWHATQLRSLPGNLVIVPNAKLAQAIVTNFDLPTADIGFGTEVTVGADSDLAEVERICLAVARDVMKTVPGGMPEAEPSIRFLSFSNIGVTCAVNVRGRTFVDQYLVRHELVKRLHAALTSAGVRIATVHAPQPKKV